jgi:hypothetical protein
MVLAVNTYLASRMMNASLQRPSRRCPAPSLYRCSSCNRSSARISRKRTKFPSGGWSGLELKIRAWLRLS